MSLHFHPQTTTGRVCGDVRPPASGPLPNAFKKNLPSLDAIKEHFLAEGALAKKDALELVHRAAALFRKEKNILELSAPVVVCGDVHGQYYDLMKLFEVGGDPQATKYLFLGDYVDRGAYSCEVILYMFALKISFPETFFMIRGNHECRHVTNYFTFKEECEHKYDPEVYNVIMDAFDTLPLAALLIDKARRYFCVHGGLSPELFTLAEIEEIDRFQETPTVGPMCDLLWSDPAETFDDAPPDTYYDLNHARGCSFVYSFQAVTEFLQRNDLMCVIRAHEAQDQGYRFYKQWDVTRFPALITLFSAPNYYQLDDNAANKAAIIKCLPDTMTVRQFNFTTTPYSLPNFMNVFAWSLPFVAEKAGGEEEPPLDDVSQGMSPEELAATKRTRQEAMRKKIIAAGRMAMYLKTLRQERESILVSVGVVCTHTQELKGLLASTDTAKLPPGLLSGGKKAIHEAVSSWQAAREADMVNEKMPGVDEAKKLKLKTQRAESLVRFTKRRGEKK